MWLRESCTGDGGQAGGWNSVMISTDDKALESWPLSQVMVLFCAQFGYLNLGRGPARQFSSEWCCLGLLG